MGDWRREAARSPCARNEEADALAATTQALRNLAHGDQIVRLDPDHPQARYRFHLLDGRSDRLSKRRSLTDEISVPHAVNLAEGRIVTACLEQGIEDPYVLKIPCDHEAELVLIQDVALLMV